MDNGSDQTLLSERAIGQNLQDTSYLSIMGRRIQEKSHRAHNVFKRLCHDRMEEKPCEGGCRGKGTRDGLAVRTQKN